MNRTACTVLTILLLATGIARAEVHSATRYTVIISDLHLGLGCATKTTCHPFEDFRWTDDLRRFLAELSARTHNNADLVLNGDTFELWQSEDQPCTSGRSHDQSCTEREAVERLTAIAKMHATDLQLLKDFAAQGDNRLLIVPGNHDAALLFEQVFAALGPYIGDSPRVLFLDHGYFLSDDKKLYAEHGHQFDEINRFTHWQENDQRAAPFTTTAGVKYLQRPWGEEFVQSFYNTYEKQYEIIDNIAGEINGIRYGLAAEGIAGALVSVGRFAKFFVLRQSVRQFRDLLDAPQAENTVPSDWDIAKIRAQGDVFFEESVPRDDPTRALMKQARTQGLLETHVNDLTTDEIQQICEFRHALATTYATTHKGASPVIERCTDKHLRAISKAALSLIEGDKLRWQYIQARQRDLRQSGRLPNDEVFDIVVMSHTHSERGPIDIRGRDPRAWHPVFYDTGAWQRIVTVAEVELMRGTKKRSQVLTDYKVDDLRPCYTAVIIPPYEQKSKPTAELDTWRPNAAGTWTLAPGTCH